MEETFDAAVELVKELKDEVLDGLPRKLIKTVAEKASSIAEKNTEDDSPKDCNGQHNYQRGKCLICTICGYCTDKGPWCKSSGDRLPGSECGCGDADAGCKHCGACIVCNNDPIPEDHNIYPKLENLENAIVLYEEGRKRIKKIKDKAKKKSESNELLKEKTTEFRIGFEGKSLKIGQSVKIHEKAIRCNVSPEPSGDIEDEEDHVSVEEIDGCVSDTPKLECKHIYEIGPHKVCTKCGYCTGFGPGCTNSHLDNRAPGMICGCGKGEAGCRVCGQCQICTGDPLPENHSLEEVAELEKIVALYECGRKKVERLNEEMDIHWGQTLLENFWGSACQERHEYEKSDCRICTKCGLCTGQGPSCLKTYSKMRHPGLICGCGEGEAGCRVCGQCQICTGDPLPENHSLEEVVKSDDVVEIYQKWRQNAEIIYHLLNQPSAREFSDLHDCTSARDDCTPHQHSQVPPSLYHDVPNHSYQLEQLTIAEIPDYIQCAFSNVKQKMREFKERTLDTFLQSAEFFRQLTENSDIRRIAANLNRLKLITEDQFRLLNAMPNKKEANEHFYDSLVKEKSFEKLEIFCNALQVDTTFENHQILKQMIRHFLNPDPKKDGHWKQLCWIYKRDEIQKLLDNESFFNLLIHVSDVRRIVASLHCKEVISGGEFQQISQSATQEQANQQLYEKLVNDPSTKKIEALSAALKEDKTNGVHQTLAELIDDFNENGCLSRIY